MNALMDKVEVLECADTQRALQLCIHLLKRVDPTHIAPDKEHGLKRMKKMMDNLRTCERYARAKVAREFLYQ